MICLNFVMKIANGDRKHPVWEEKKYQILERSKGNDRANLEWIGDNEKTPIINEFLLNCGFNEKDEVLFWVCW